MAVGTVSIIRSGDVLGDLRLVVANATLNGTYAAGGEPLTAAKLGLSQVVSAIAQTMTQIATFGPSEVAAVVQADGSVKLKCYSGTLGTESSGTDTNAVIQVQALGY